MAITNIAMFGDSLTQGMTAGVLPSFRQGGTGNYVERYALWRAHRDRVAIIGDGYHGLWLNDGITGLDDANQNLWTGTGTWTQTTTSDAYDRAPNGRGITNSAGGTLTYTYRWPYSMQGGFAIYWLDVPGGGNWQYRKDAGTWTAMGQTRSEDNGLKKLFIAGPITSTVEIRAYNGTSDVLCAIAGGEPYRTSPVGATGVIVHNMGCAGDTLNTLVRTTSSGDPLAWLDDVTFGTNAPDHTPTEVWLLYSNDVTLAVGSTTLWEANLRAFWSRVGPWPHKRMLNCYEQGGARLDGTHSTAAEQEQFRDAAATVCAEYGVTLVDIYDLWQRQYGGTLTPSNGTVMSAALAAGVLYSDEIHKTQAGHFDVARRVAIGG